MVVNSFDELQLPLNGSCRSLGHLSQWLHSLPDPSFHVVLGHVSILVGEQLLRVRQVAGIGCSLGSNIPKLKIHLGQGPGLVKA